MNDIKLADLIDIEALQRIQDGFSRYTGMAAITTDVDGIPVTKDSGFTRFCYELTRKSELGCKNCEKCDSEGAFKTLERGRATVYVCHAGLMDFAAPIMLEGNVIGSFVGGQVRIGALDEKEIAAKAVEYGIDPVEYVKASEETSLLSREDVEKAAEFIAEIASAISRMAYKSFLELKESERMGRVAKSQADYVMNMSMNLENMMDKWFRVLDENTNVEGPENMSNVLSLMQSDGADIRNSIKETIGFIKMSANDVEVSESEYELSQLVSMIKNSVVDDIPVSVMHADSERLFGDVVRIGQMVTKSVKWIYDGKPNVNMEILLSTKKIGYAMYLNIVIMDKNTIYTEQEIEKMRAYFQKKDEGRFEFTSELGMWLSLEGMLLSSMSGTMVMNKVGNDFVMKISIPQIGL